MLTVSVKLQAATIIVFSYLSDRTRHRAGFIAILALMTTAGVLATAYASQPGVRYFGEINLLARRSYSDSPLIRALPHQLWRLGCGPGNPGICAS